MKCPKFDHENSTEDSVKQVAEYRCDCHKETHSLQYLWFVNSNTLVI